MKCVIITEFLIKRSILAVYRPVLEVHIRGACCEDGMWVSPRVQWQALNVPIVLMLGVVPARC